MPLRFSEDVKFQNVLAVTTSIQANEINAIDKANDSSKFETGDRQATFWPQKPTDETEAIRTQSVISSMSEIARREFDHDS